MLLLNDILRDGLWNIQNMCYKFSDVTFTDTSVIEDIWLFYFIENQVSISTMKTVHMNEKSL